jgi:catechol 2,3-dioxygenase-like lactoylglutathione lyase family enzyme
MSRWCQSSRRLALKSSSCDTLSSAHLPDTDVANLTKLGYNHICFAVTDLDAEVERLTNQGVQLRTEVLDFHARKLVFLSGPEGITVELAEWHA